MLISLSLSLCMQTSIVLEEIGPRLRVRQIIIYTAIVFYRRFYQTYEQVDAAGRNLKRSLARVMLCACVYSNRQSFVNFDPHLVVGTVFFLASKVEESQLSLATVASVLHHYTTSTLLLHATQCKCKDRSMSVQIADSCAFTAGVDEDEAMYTFQDKDILECEFYVVEALQFDLILHHPFPSLLQYVVSSFAFNL